MTKTSLCWKFVTATLPLGTELMCDKAVESRKQNGLGALVKFKRTGLYALVRNGSVRMCDQTEARNFVRGWMA